MAVAELIVSRREVLGAACACPLILSGAEQGRSAVSKDVVTKWDRALARCRRAEAAIAAMAGAPDTLFDACNDRFNRALARLLRAPAPDLAGLAVKLDLLIAHEAWELDFAEPSLVAIRQDAHRLACSKE